MPTARLMAQTLSGMDIDRTFVVHGEPGWDEATPVGPFAVFDVRPGSVTEATRDPLDFGIPRCSPEDLAGGDSNVNAKALESVLMGEEDGPHRDALALGAGLVLELTGRVTNLEEGIARACEGIASGQAGNLLQKLRAFGASS